MPGVIASLKRNDATDRFRWNAEIDDHVIALEWAPTGATLAAAAIGGAITLFDVETGFVKHRLTGHTFGTCAISWNGDGTRLASGGQDGKVRIWNADTGIEMASLDAGSSWVEHVLWCGNAPLLASAAGKKLKLWDDNGGLIRFYADHPSTIADIAWKPESRDITTAHYGGLSILSPESDIPLVRHDWQGSTLVISWSPNGKFIATGDQDSTVHFWIAKSGKDLQMWGYPMKVRELSWNFSSRYLATGGGNSIVIWDCSGKGPADTKPKMLNSGDSPLTCLAWQHNGSLLAAGDQEGNLVLWQPTRNKRPLSTTHFQSDIAQIAWSPDDRQLAVGTGTGVIEVMTAP